MNNSTLVRTTSSPAKGDTAFHEVTVGPTPQQLMRKALSAVSLAPMRSFLANFFEQPEVQAILTTVDGNSAGAKLRRYTIEVLRSAAETAAYSSAFGGSEREALYVATFIEGCRGYLASTMDAGSTADDVLHTLVMYPLRRLDRQNERLAGLVRMCLGIGLPDEEDDFYVPRLRHSVQRALSRVNSRGTSRADQVLPRAAARSAANLSCY